MQQNGSLADRVGKYPPGVIAFSLGEIVRYIDFVISLQQVARPEGTYTSVGQSLSVALNMNQVIQGMRPESEWMWIQADDHKWGDDALALLLECEVDVVVPMMVRRAAPFIPVINDKVLRNRSHHAFDWRETPTSGVFEVASAGSGGMLVRRHVLEAIKEMQGHERVFEVDKGDKLAPDYVFCRKIRRAGFTIHCCADVTVGHKGTFTVWPQAVNGGWRLRFDMGRLPQTGEMASLWLDPKQELGG